MVFCHAISDKLNTANQVSIAFGNATFIATGQKVLFEPKSSILLIADCHFGKATHFRKNHLPIPSDYIEADLHQLIQILEFFNPLDCIFLGDLFHSDLNKEWELFADAIGQFNCTFHLVAGNHDILSEDHYKACGLHLHPELALNSEIILTHEPYQKEGYLNICGHIHPGISIHAKGRQRLSLPCFCISKKTLYMPAFGNLTGHVNIRNFEKSGTALCILPVGQKLISVEF